MNKEDYIKASKVKTPFKFTYTKPSLDWYADVNVSIAYDKYNYLILERRYGDSWWLLGCKYIEDKDKWVEEQIGEIGKKDIPRLVEWAEYTDGFGHQVSILNEIRTIDGCLNPIREFLRSMGKYKTEIEPQPKTGEWIATNDYVTTAYGSLDYYRCSYCGEDSLEEGNFCPNCGADMREVQDGNS